MNPSASYYDEPEPEPAPAHHSEAGADFVAALLHRGLTCGLHRPALISDETQLGYMELRRQVTVVAWNLARLGLAAGHRLALVLPPGPSLIPLLLGALHRGLLVSVLSTTLGPAALAYRLAELAPDLVLHDANELFRLDVLAGLGAPRSPGSALLLWTSGSMGQPRGVLLTTEAVLWNARRNASALGLLSTDRTLVVLDAAYCYALIHQIFSHLYVGAAVVLRADTSAQHAQLGPVCVRHQITTLAMVPSMLRTLIRLPWLGESLRGLRVLTIGGATIPESLLQETHQTLPAVSLYITYGLTEAGPRVCTRRYQPELTLLAGNVGVPLPGIALRVDAAGELWVQSPSVRLGYVVRGELALAEAPSDWVRTGDLAELQPDGSVRVLGRLRPLINRAGVKIAPGEIERILEEHPSVAQARVVAMPHQRLGDVPLAYVVPRPGLSPCPTALMSHCRELLGAAFVPAQVELVAQLPMAFRSWKEVVS